MSAGKVQNVADTAFWVAIYRAEETRRPDSLFKDELAGKLAGERGRAISKSMAGAKYTRWSVVIRTRIIDDLIEKLIRENAIDCVVNLGAGLDTRPYRMNLPADFRWIEADNSGMIDYKKEKLAADAPRCRLEQQAVDLANPAARKKFLSEISGVRALVLTEGVLPYLTEEIVAELALELKSNSAFRFWLADYFSPGLKRFMNSGKRRRQMENAPFLFMPDDWFGFFAKCGWVARQTVYIGEETEKLGRRIPLPWFAKIFMLFVSETKKTEARRRTAYVLLEVNHEKS